MGISTTMGYTVHSLVYFILSNLLHANIKLIYSSFSFFRQNNGKGDDDKNLGKKDLEKSLSDLEHKAESLAGKFKDLNADFQKFTNEFLSKHSALVQNFKLLKEHAAMVNAEIRKNLSP